MSTNIDFFYTFRQNYIIQSTVRLQARHFDL